MYTLMRLLNLKVPEWLANFRKQSTNEALRMRLAPPPHFQSSGNSYSDSAKPFRLEPFERPHAAPAKQVIVVEAAPTETIDDAVAAEAAPLEAAALEAALPASSEPVLEAAESADDERSEAEAVDSASWVQTEAMPNGAVCIEPTEDQIRMRAYELYLDRNGAAGDDTQDWLRAEAELRSMARASAN